MMLCRSSGVAAVFVLSMVGPLRAQERVVLGFEFHGDLPMEGREAVEDPVALATAAWVDSVRVFLGPEVLQLQAYGWFPAREGETPHYMTQIVGLPVLAGDVATGMVVLAVTVLEANIEDDSWRYVSQSVDYYEGDAREAVPRIIATVSDAIAPGRDD